MKLNAGLSFARAALALVIAFCLPALAQNKAADPAAYQGADRQQRLTEGAKKEGTLTIYHSSPVEDMRAFTAAFEKKTGIKAVMWRSSSENVLRRAVTEARAGRFDADIIETNSPELEALHREKLLVEVKSPHLADLIPQAIPTHREWIGVRLNIFAFAYNTQRARKADLPKTYEDLLNARWKGNLGTEAADFDWFAALMNELGEARGVKLFTDIVRTNGMSVRSGHTLLANLVGSGEVPLALTVYNYKAEQMKNAGAPVDWFVIPPAFARPVGVGMMRRAPHPNASVLFFDYMLTDAQDLFLKRDFIPTNRNIKTPLSDFPFKVIDARLVLDEYDKWSQLYKQIMLNQR